MKIVHESLFVTDKIADFYSEKDGVPVKYVCTSALGGQEFAVDVFYRSTPHPDFGNHYFGIYRNPHWAGSNVMITNADVIEELKFGMVEDDDGNFHYSAHRHDYKMLENGNMIDGGRAYVRTNTDTTMFKVKDGEFQEVPIEDASGTDEEVSKMEEQGSVGSEQRGVMGDLKFTTAGDYINGKD